VIALGFIPALARFNAGVFQLAIQVLGGFFGFFCRLFCFFRGLISSASCLPRGVIGLLLPFFGRSRTTREHHDQDSARECNSSLHSTPGV